MKTRIATIACLLLLFASLLHSQVTRAGNGMGEVAYPQIEIPVSFDAVWANAPAGQCGCFWMLGGGAGAVLNFTPHWSAVIDLLHAQASNLNGTNERLAIFNYQVGPRFSMRGHDRWVPYGQVLIGGSDVFSNYSIYGEGRNTFSTTVGGGVTARLSEHIGLTVGEADWMFSRADNNVNTRQNNLRLTSGIIFRFSPPPMNRR
jgi:outer membrane immunogenic protein